MDGNYRETFPWKCNYCEEENFIDKLNYILHILEHHITLRGKGNE